MLEGTIIFLSLVPVFMLLEYWYKLQPKQPIFRGYYWQDWFHFFMNIGVMKFLTASFFTGVAYLAGQYWPSPLLPWLQLLPKELHFIIAILFLEISSYWAHRILHTVPFLWKFHAVHHAAEELDWVVSARAHPIDFLYSDIIGGFTTHLMSFPPDLFIFFTIFRTFIYFYSHCNAKIHHGWLQWLVVSPMSHHWHHNNDPAFHNKNFSPRLPFIDWVFGTLYLPKDGRFPPQIGVPESVPTDYINQMLYPFSKQLAKIPASGSTSTQQAG